MNGICCLNKYVHCLNKYCNIYLKYNKYALKTVFANGYQIWSLDSNRDAIWIILGENNNFP